MQEHSFVIVKHENSDKQYTFKAYQKLNVGDMVVVNTKVGLQVGTVVGDAMLPFEEAALITGDVVAKFGSTRYKAIKRHKERLRVLKAIQAECGNKKCKDCMFLGADRQCSIDNPLKWNLPENISE